MTDSHCHVFFPRFDGDRQEVLERAYARGVHRMVQVNCDERGQELLLRNVATTVSPVQLYGTIGVHPTEFVEGSVVTEVEQRRMWDFFVSMMESYGDHVVAVGETGFDFFHPHSREAQEVYFRLQLAFAREYKLPVVLHLRDAFPEAFAVLREHREQPMVFHCFTGTKEEMDIIVREFPNAMISFSGVVTYPKSHALQEVATLLPLERMLVETDCPFLAPQVVRGKRNEPAFVTHVAEYIAELRGIAYEAVEQATDRNCDVLFGFGDPSTLRKT